MSNDSHINNSNNNMNNRNHHKSSVASNNKYTSQSKNFNSAQSQRNLQLSKAPGLNSRDVDSSDVSPVCFICAEKVSIWALGPCSHRTCHVCTLRLRALFKSKECTFCKSYLDQVLFVSSSTKLFGEYDDIDNWPVDSKLNIKCENKEILSNLLSLLRFNCSRCDYIAAGWLDYKNHAKNVHKSSLCDLCIKYKKNFTHEYKMYSQPSLLRHLPPLPSFSSKAKKVQPALDAHPGCDFCIDHFYSEDELFKHMRESHEECFLCKQAGIRMLYFKDYPALEKHFSNDHYPCTYPSCIEKKFVVFSSELDLRGHHVEEHGAQLTAKERKDVSRVEVNWSSSQRQPQNQALPQQTRNATGSGRRANFNNQLTNVNNNNNNSNPASAVATPALDAAPVDPEIAAQHAELIQRVLTYTKSQNAVQAFRFTIRSYRSNESTPRDVVNALYSILKNNIDATASVCSKVSTLLENEEQSRNLDLAWKKFRAEIVTSASQSFPTLSDSRNNGSSSNNINTAASKAALKPLPLWDRVPSSSSSTNNNSSNQFPSLTKNGKNTKTTSTMTSTTPSNGWASSSKVPPQVGRSNVNNNAFPALPSSVSQAKANAERRALFQPHQTRTVHGHDQYQQSSASSSQVDDSNNNSNSNNNNNKSNKKQQKKKQTLISIGL